MRLALITGVAGVFGGLVLGMLVGWWYRGFTDHDREFEAYIEDATDDKGHSVTLDAPAVGSGLWSLLSYVRHRGKEKRMAKRGYVKWYKFSGGMLKPPKWVKPERDGTGVPQYYDSDDDQTYFFPTDPLVTDSQTGAPIAVHHSGQVEPVNIADPEVPPIDGDRLEELINLSAESDPPGFFDKMDLDGQTIMWIGIGSILLLGAVQNFMM